jgi:hypothetical protein
MGQVYLVRECDDNAEKVLGVFFRESDAIQSCQMSVPNGVWTPSGNYEKVIGTMVVDGYTEKLYVEKACSHTIPMAFIVS